MARWRAQRPNKGSILEPVLELWHEGKKIAVVAPMGKHKPAKGWYWYTFGYTDDRINTANEIVATKEEAKDQVAAWWKAQKGKIHGLT